MTDDKYKQFRNFMTNELGITRNDIEAWTKEAVATEVLKKFGQMNIEEMLTRAINKEITSKLGWNYSSVPTVVKDAVKAAVNEIIGDRIDIKLK